jgi:hypothetical protein
VSTVAGSVAAEDRKRPPLCGLPSDPGIPGDSADCAAMQMMLNAAAKTADQKPTILVD